MYILIFWFRFSHDGAFSCAKSVMSNKQSDVDNYWLNFLKPESVTWPHWYELCACLMEGCMSTAKTSARQEKTKPCLRKLTWAPSSRQTQSRGLCGDYWSLETLRPKWEAEPELCRDPLWMQEFRQNRLFACLRFTVPNVLTLMETWWRSLTVGA